MIFKSILDIKKSQLKRFDCKNPALNEYLVRFAKQNEKKHLSRTYILEEGNFIVGYVTLCGAQIETDEVGGVFLDLPKYPIPAIRIARLAVDFRKQNQHYGQELLKFAFIKIINISKEIGVKVIVVDVKEESEYFYKKYFFSPFPNKPRTFYLEIETLIKASEEK